MARDDDRRSDARPDDLAGGADVIIAAAGSSSRMGGRDKLGLMIGQWPLLAWTVRAVAAAPEVARIVVVVAEPAVSQLATAAWLPTKTTWVVAGGARRQESVAAGLEALDVVDASAGRSAARSDERVILVHDGARPAVSPALVGAVVRAAAAHGAAIPILPISDTVKRLEGERIGGTLDRATLGIAQTPQGMRRGILRGAFDRYPAGGTQTWTDEAALLEACRIAVRAIPGEVSNVKVTTPDDLLQVEATLLARASPRIGYGEDSHPFGRGLPLALGAITIDNAPRLHGHSDGDVALHAVADALLGAAGLGDLGRLFPAGPVTPQDVASVELLRDVLLRLEAVGLRPASVDLTIVAARPRLAPRLDAMRDAIGALLGLPSDRINVKASTGNLAGDDGAGRGISARAVALVEPGR